LAVVLALALGIAAVACDFNTIVRPSEAVVLTGAELGELVGVAPNDIVAFAHSRPNGTATWTQIPVQVDERVLTDFGAVPGSNATPGTDGTVYGTTPIGVTTLQYADPDTFVGADPNVTFDADDELVFMSGDGGGVPRQGEETEPAGVVPGSGVRVQFEEPLTGDRWGWVYLFVSDGSLDPSAGRDYVDYDFTLTSGPYKTTYQRADGPNPETSRVTTDVYQAGFGDRWIEDDWRVTTGGATGVDLLDGSKARFALTTCARSNATFADAEGAFVANIDGPVRAIRSFIGANSGPLTQRTHIMYRDRIDAVTDLRVHAIPGIMDYVDYSTAAVGMTYRSSAHPDGVVIDGAADAISTAVPSWELVSGPQGSVMISGEVEGSIIPPEGVDAVTDGFYRDELDSSFDQCWGDAHFLGASGLSFVIPIPNTDPRATPFDVVQATRHVRFTPPDATAEQAATWSEGIEQPLVPTVSPYAP
jgi:hypothetical protein